MSKRIAIVEDEAAIRENYADVLRSQGYQVQTYADKESATQAFKLRLPHLVILDIGLPKLDGFHVCHELREVYDEPIIVLTARETDEEQISAFKLGADDFITKPVSPNVLKVRLDAMLRRKPAKEERPLHAIRVGNIALYPQANKCEIDGRAIRLSSFEFQLLALLLRNVGRVMTRDAIYNVLLNREYNGVERTVDVRISKLRDKLINDGMQCARIETVWGKGYIVNETAG